jgi:preprotein translocase subunit SecG
METVLLVVQLMIAIAMIVVILFQRTAQDGGGLVGGGGGGGTMGGLFTARGSANLLTRTTAVLATLFILNSLTLGYIASSQHNSRSVIDQIAPQAPATDKDKPAVPTESSKPETNSTAPVPPPAPEQSAPKTSAPAQPATPPSVPLQ